MGNIPSEVNPNQSMRWWAVDTEHLATAVTYQVKDLTNKQRARSGANSTYYKLMNMQSMIGPSTDQRFSAQLYDRLTLNITKQVTETLGAKLFQEEVKAICLTEAGNFRQQSNAKKLEKFIDGMSYITNHHNKSESVFYNAATFGKGFLKSVIGKEGISTEWVLSDKLKFNEDECLFSPPKTLYQVEYYDKYDLAELYPDQAENIMLSSGFHYADDVFFRDLVNERNRITNLVMVVECWRLGKRHCIATDKAVLVDEEYKHDYFPFTSFSIFPRLTGVWDEGIAERLLFNQFEINKTLRTIGKIIHIGCVPKIFIDASGDIRIGQFTNAIGDVIKYTGTKPEQGQLMKVPPELWEHLKMFIGHSMQEVGLNDFMVRGEKPQGVYSAKAQSEYLSVVEGRLFSIIKNWQQFHMETFKLWIKLHRDNKLNKAQITALGEDGFETIKWKEIEYDERSMVLQMYAGNLLSKHPATKQTQVNEMMNAGLFDRDQALELLDYPDIRRVTGNDLAPRKLIQKIISKIIENGMQFRAHENLFIDVAIPLVTKACAYYKTMDSPPTTLPLLERFRDELVAFQQDKLEQQMIMEQQIQMQQQMQSQAQPNAKPAITKGE